MSKTKPPLLTIEEAKAKGLWFVSHSYGYGWTPITWQGWLTILAFVAIVVFVGMRTIEVPEPTAYNALIFLKTVTLSVIVLLWVCWKKGEKAYWRWGK